MNAVQENLRDWLENPSWAEYYNGAPTDRCKQFISLEFYYSEYEEEETAEAMDAIEDRMDAEELRYLMAWAGNSPRRSRLAEKIEKKGSCGSKSAGR